MIELFFIKLVAAFNAASHTAVIHSYLSHPHQFMQ